MSKQNELVELSRVFDTSALSNRNLIINGAQNIAQRGTSFTSQNTSHFVTDRFEPTMSSYGIWTTEQSSDAPDGFSKSLKMTCTTADTSPSSNDYCRISYLPEAQDLQHLNFGSSAAKTTTVSFWVKSNVVATYVFWMYQPDNANTRQINKLFTVDTADTWEYKTLTIEGDTSGTINNDNGVGMLIGWILSSGTGYTSGTRPANWTNHTAADRWAGLTADVGGTVNNYFQITGVQWEVGTEATPFEHRSFGDELARCQRYYEIADTEGSDTRRISMNKGSTGSNYYWGLEFRVTKRAKPTCTITQSYNDNLTLAVHSTATGKNHMGIRSETGGSTDTRALAEFTAWTADAEL